MRVRSIIQPGTQPTAFMKKNLFGSIIITVWLLVSLPAMGQTTFFSDTFSNGSTVNQAPTAPTAHSTSYQSYIGLAGGAASVSANGLAVSLPSNGSVLGEIVALFTNVPVVLSMPGDFVTVTVVFTNTANILSGGDTQNSSLNIGLFHSGGVSPNQGLIQLNTGTASGGTQGWLGYIGKILWSGNSSILTRPAQTAGGTSSQNQDLLFNNASSAQAFNSPTGASLGSTATTGTALTPGTTYTVQLLIAFNSVNSLWITNTLYSGVGTGGSVVFTQSGVATNTTFLTGGFDGFAIGWRNASTPAQVSTMDISSITVIGLSTPPCCCCPIFGPVSVVVATNGSCAFSVDVAGFSLAYQWHRNGTNLLDGGNISGSTSARLVISTAGTNDVASGPNGYYVTVTGPGGFSIDSTNASLTLDAAANLTWSGNGTVWDVATSSNWLAGGVNAAFNYGDNVIFDDTAGLGDTTVNLAGPYLSAGSVTVSNSGHYAFTGSGSIAGPGALIYEGSGPLTMNCINSYTGGTIISNAFAWLVLSNYSALGNGPVTFAKAGGLMEVVPAGNAITGITGDIIVADDFTIQFDGNGSFAGVFLGNLFGTAGKTLTLQPFSGTSTNRYRVYGNNMVYNANLVVDGQVTSQAVYDGTVLAPYQSSGSQTYNGVISGNGGLVQRGSGTTILNGANTYAGGTTPTTGTIAFGTDTVGAVSSGPIGTGPLFLAPELSNATGSGQVMAWGGARTIANPIQYPSATNNQTLIVGGTNALTFTGPITLNGNDMNGAFTNRIFQVTNTALTTFSGGISDGGLGFGLIKTGKGVLALNGVEAYTGPTTVSNGILQVNGSLDALSFVMVCSNGILAGTGTVNGAVTVQTNGALAPGGASFGTLYFSRSLDLAGNVKVRVDRSGFASDQANVSGPLNNIGAGAVLVTNMGAVLQLGDTFAPFSKAVTGGDNLKVIGAGVGWNNRLAVNGTIMVSSTNPPTMVTSLSGSTLTLNWPSDYFGWVVQSNSVSLTSTNWFTVPNTGNATSYAITITSAKTNVFYRLVQP